MLWPEFSRRFVAASLLQLLFEAPTRTAILLEAAALRIRLFEGTRATLSDEAARRDMQSPRASPGDHPAMIEESDYSSLSRRGEFRKAHFGFQLIRTSTFVAADARDKIFGVLGISSFVSGRIVPDYTKSIEAVFTETAAVLLTERHADFYMSFTLKALPAKSSSAATPKRQLPSWVPDFTPASTTPHNLPELEEKSTVRHAYHRPLYVLASPVEQNTPEVLQQKCAYHSSSRPFARVSSDMRTLRTYSLPIGTVVNIVPSLGNGRHWSSPLATKPCALRDLYSCNLEPRHVSIKNSPLALFPPNARYANEELEKALTVAINSETSKQDAGPPRGF